MKEKGCLEDLPWQASASGPSRPADSIKHMSSVPFIPLNTLHLSSCRGPLSSLYTLKVEGAPQMEK